MPKHSGKKGGPSDLAAALLQQILDELKDHGAMLKEHGGILKEHGRQLHDLGVKMEAGFQFLAAELAKDLALRERVFDVEKRLAKIEDKLQMPPSSQH